MLVAGGLPASMTEPIYGTRYDLSPLPAATLEEWAVAPPHAALHLPPPNRFLPDDLSILTPAPPTPAASADDDADDADADGASASASADASAGLYRPRGPTRLSSLDAAGRTVWPLHGHLP